MGEHCDGPGPSGQQWIHKIGLQPSHAPPGPLAMKTARAWGASLLGWKAELVTVEGRFESWDRPRTEVVLTGLPDTVLRESRGKLLCALRENRLGLGQGQLYLNLVPAARPKSGESLDLPLVLAAACAAGHLNPADLVGTLFLGEVGIDGRLHPVPGGLAAAMAARGAGSAAGPAAGPQVITRMVAPPATAQEAAALPDLDVRVATTLAEVVGHLASTEDRLPRAQPPPPGAGRCSGPHLDDVRGQAAAKYALSIAAAGGHGLLLVGPPGAGKTMLARRLPRLLPAPTLDERLEATAVLAATGRWPGGLVAERLFRAPHHTASYAGVIGGGANLSPGEVSLAHGGVLFLDELPEYRREVLEALREPVEQGSVTISRAGRQVDFPARFLLVAAMNPCPCGYRGHPSRACTCAPGDVRRYARRLSGPLLDRIDLRLELQPPTSAELAGPPATTGHAKLARGGVSLDRSGPTGPALSELQTAVDRATEARLARGQAVPNARLGPDAIDRALPLDDKAALLLERAAEARSLSARAIQSLRRVALTLADLSEDPERNVSVHLARALALRQETYS